MASSIGSLTSCVFSLARSTSTTTRIISWRRATVPTSKITTFTATTTITRQSSSRRNYASKTKTKTTTAGVASGSNSSKPIVLEKPAKFIPPSHGSRLPSGKGPRHYGGALSENELKSQARRDYPGMPPPPGSFGHTFWNSPKLHAWITIGTLGSLAGYTLTERFKDNSPYAFMIPSLYDWLRHPIDSVQACAQMLMMHTDYQTREAMESRRQSIEDVTKRKKYRRAHNVEDKTFLNKVIPDKYLKNAEDALEERYGEESQKKAKEEALEPKERKKGWGIF